MTSIGTGYDLSNSVFSPDGRNFQVEYASKAVENGGTSIGIRVPGGVVLAVEKLITSKLLVPNSNRRIESVDRHCGIVFSGLVPDGRHFVSRARSEAESWRSQYEAPIGVKTLADRMGGYAQAYTLYSSVRPFGITAIIGGVDENGPQLYMIEPSGSYWGYFGAATGKGRQAAKAEIEKLDLQSLSLREAVNHAARIIHVAHDESKDKDFELEMTWIGDETNNQHKPVPEELVKEARRLAIIAIEGEDEEEDEKMEE